MKNISIFAALMLLLASCTAPAGRWSADKANRWYAQQPWLSGCNYIPSNAINQIEMWSDST